ncbi:MAG: hypothetical protein JOZ68_14780 [Acidimicrobiia bacterium]|nr:hypothetical protein [Acidimicrobiia bacterium]
MEEWTRSAAAVGVNVPDAPRFVAQVCALIDLRRQESELCQQTHGLVPFG